MSTNPKDPNRNLQPSTSGFPDDTEARRKDKELLIVATQYIYAGISDEKAKWTQIAQLYNANNFRGVDLTSSKAQEMYMLLENDGDNVWRKWKDIKPEDKRVEEAKERIKDKKWEDQPHVSDNYV